MKIVAESNTSQFSESQVREVLQYVPIFRDQTFVVAFDGGILPDPVVAELLLDLLALQNIGVSLVLAYFGEDKNDFLDWAAEIEFKLSESSLESAKAVLSRGQAALISMDEELMFSANLLVLSSAVEAGKVLYLANRGTLPDYFEGAIKVSEAREIYESTNQSSHYANAIVAAEQGVKRVHLLDGTMLGCLSHELFSNEGVGTMIYDDSYLEVRNLSEEDIPELLAIIGRSIRSRDLLPRTYEDIEKQLQDYHVMTIDGNVVGCIALHRYDGEEMAEIACLFVKPSHVGLGYGGTLVRHAELIASEFNIKTLFALSSSAGGFFERNLGYHPMGIEQIPTSRFQKLSESGRCSIALKKELTG